MKKDLLSEFDLAKDDFECIFEKAKRQKRIHEEGRFYQPLRGKTLGMIFDKSSTRTRISFEVGMYQLGGIALFLNSRDTQLGRGENIMDSARIMSRYLDGIMIRTFSQKAVEEFARHASIPVINGLTDLLHPCQILSDLFTIMEKKGAYEGKTIAYIGDGNNIANSWINAAARLPIRLALACPEGYRPDRRILARALKNNGADILLTDRPEEAVKGADIVYTDVWASMGQEHEQEERAGRFQRFQVNERLLKHARKDALVMHCLPAHRGEEITAEVLDGPQSIVVDQAENRLHVQKAILEILL
ncbi:MAG: ornithine carbamoyltransferase [Syntrophales bacterium]|jgi:ornithine carbamoyltransferase|nr:ornithine carbamoyltransferase [Syntrophales bacterium]MDD4339657.1 ornithine carbamoyltransferase [Syntrophales bacterium]HOG08349.1 ornithine carbamoyltransferase [Syntrophales bacterium]HOS77896.1 ornithine carbamoyltransferase [Syntrophales bacterium]HPB70465.1 ornithine carbamoyltransferase [Syntrophales bacterium]